MLKDFDIYSLGIISCSVCSNLSLEETTQRLNKENPSGINSKWSLSSEKFRSGEDNPCACNLSPETHKHYLFNC